MKNPLGNEIAHLGHKSGQEVAKMENAPRATSRGSHARLKEKIRSCTRAYFGRSSHVPFFVLRVKHGRHRKHFQLKSGLDESVEMAQQILDRLRLDGWERTVEIYRPRDGKKVTDLTIGEYLALLAEHTELDPFTLRNYARALRTLVGGIKGLTHVGQEKYSGSDAASPWREAVDKVFLDTITASEVVRWRTKYLQKGIEAGRKRTSVEHTANTIVRNARSLFAKRTLHQLKLALPSLVLPSPLPFEGVILLKEHEADFHYVSSIDAGALINKAFAELKGELLVIFCLAIGGGLRRKEIDNVEWSHVNLVEGKVRVANPRHRRLKSDSSAGTVALEQRFIEVLKQHAKNGSTGYVLFPDRLPRPPKGTIYYRCNAEFDQVLSWLRQNGVTNTDKPIHTLRKEFGSNIAAAKGIHAASASLRHSTVALTDKYYAERTAQPTNFFTSATNAIPGVAGTDAIKLLEFLKVHGFTLTKTG